MTTENVLVPSGELRLKRKILAEESLVFDIA